MERVAGTCLDDRQLINSGQKAFKFCLIGIIKLVFGILLKQFVQTTLDQQLAMAHSIV